MTPSPSNEQRALSNEQSGISYEQKECQVFGASSLVGRYLLSRLSSRGYRGIAVSRKAKPASFNLPKEFVWHQLVGDSDVLLPPTGIIFSLLPMLTLPSLLARTSKATRIIALSTSSAEFKIASEDRGERRLAQSILSAESFVKEYCENNGMTWTVFRPTLIYDPGHDRNVSAIADFIRKFQMFPIVWPGTGRRQPIHADDVAHAMVAALNAPHGRNAILGLPGGETLMYRDMIRRVFIGVRRPAILVYLPLSVTRQSFRLWQSITGSEYSIAALNRMNMDLTLDPAPVRETLDIDFRAFHPQFPRTMRRQT